MSHSVKRHLRLALDEYDEAIRQWIPGYEEMLTVAAEAVAEVSPGRVLDLGAGTGALTERVLAKAPQAVVEMWDVDPDMLDQAGPRVERFGARAVSRVRSYFDAFPPCDAIMGSLSLHHIGELQRKARVYRQGFDALRPGGVFVLADATVPAEPAPRQATFQEWADHMVNQGIPEPQAWAHFDEWAEEDTYLPLDTEVAAMEEAGFEVTVPWREGPMSVVVGQRPGG